VAHAWQDRPVDFSAELWVETVDQHPAWQRSADSTDSAKAGAAGLVAHLADVRRRDLAALDTDPWQDTGFAVRMARHVGHLLSRVPERVRLSPGEAALLTTVPFVHDTLWANLAASVRTIRPRDLAPAAGATGDRAAFERFVQTYPRLRRRATLGASSVTAAAPIGWWLLHRWVARRPTGYEPATVEAMVGDSLDAARVAELLHALRADPGFLSRTDRAGALQAVDETGTVRERLVGYLLAVAYELAVEPAMLPDVVVEHVGIGDPVSLTELRTTVDGLRWRPRGSVLVLDARCAHPAVEVAVRGHVEAAAALLAECQRVAVTDPSLAPLAHLPVAVASDGIQAAESAYLSAGVRFRLAEDRVQELLMGEQLYGDPALAVRELYQNALDACRYRQARTEYLSRIGRANGNGKWAGEIRFEQGSDESGRPYLDCVDNGIGMGVRELKDVFSQAGVRMADLPEFVEERAEWARLDPPVTLYLNSRFGIGVLSYFMLADEIEVQTCRLGRDGRPGELLQVSIAGPGNLFRVRGLGPGDDAGTRVRLYLRSDGEPPSCVDVLRRVLWVADFDTFARHGGQTQVWLAGELLATALSDYDPDDDDDDEHDHDHNHDEEVRPAGPSVVATPDRRVWWCSGEGAILADGLVAGESMFGAVVNLAHELAPRLSVDRTKILAYGEKDVDRLLADGVIAVATAEGGPLSLEWLSRLSRTRPRIADDIFDAAIEAGHTRWKGGDGKLDVAVAGCFPADAHSISADEIAEWQLTAQAAGGRYRKLLKPTDDWRVVVRARPSDFLLLSEGLQGSDDWLHPEDPVSLGHLARAALRLGRTAGEIAERLDLLGYRLAPGADRLVVHPDDALLTSRDLDSVGPFLDTGRPVALLHALRVADRTGRDVPEVAERLETLGHLLAFDARTAAVVRLEPDDTLIASCDLDSAQPWLDPAQPVPLAHLVRAAHQIRRDPPAIADRLRLLGYLVPYDVPDRVDPHDIVYTSRDLDGSRPWLNPADVVPVPHLLRAARKTGRSLQSIVERLAAIGYLLPIGVEVVESAELTDEDLLIASTDLDGAAPWLDASRPVGPVHLVQAGQRTGKTTREVAARLSAIGYRVAPGIARLDLDEDDSVITSRDLDSSDPWLDPAEPVSRLHLLAAADAVGKTAAEVAERLVELGFTVGVDISTLGTERLDREDLIVASRDLDGAQPWLDPTEPVPAVHVYRSAGRVRRNAAEVARRLVAMGFTLAVDPATLGSGRIEPEDLVAASRDLDSKQPWLPVDRPVPISHLVRAAKRTRRTVAEIAERLSGLGYEVPVPAERLPRLRPGTRL
jgi:hypothetical protein